MTSLTATPWPRSRAPNANAAAAACHAWSSTAGAL